jgi:hypothetical protein
VETERYAYAQTGLSVFKETAVLSVVADAVHVGNEDWLNVFVCDAARDLSFVCPQQAGEVFFCTCGGFRRHGSGRRFVREIGPFFVRKSRA